MESKEIQRQIDQLMHEQNNQPIPEFEGYARLKCNIFYIIHSNQIVRLVYRNLLIMSIKKSLCSTR